MSAHLHPCDGCQVGVACDGELAENPDGWPDVICRAVHRPNGETAEVWCENCRVDEFSEERRREEAQGEP